MGIHSFRFPWICYDPSFGLYYVCSLGMTGIWLAFPAAEFITMGMTLAGVWGFFSKVNLVGKSL